MVDKNGVRSAGGYIITPMPDATEEDISKLEQNILKAGAVSKMLDQNLSLEEIAKKITGDDNVKIIEKNIVPIYKCDCSKEHMAEALGTLGKDELENIIKQDNGAELTCHFCNKKYNFSIQDLKQIIDKIGNK